MREIELSRDDREALRRACERAIERAEQIFEDFEPADHVKYEILGQKGIILFSTLWGIMVGIIGYAIWSRIIGWLGFVELFADLGVPAWIASNFAVFFAAWGAAGSTAIILINEAREARLQLATQRQNAIERALVLHRVVEEISDALPGVIPDLDDYSHSFGDDRPSPLIERALGRRGPPTKHRSYGRTEPPVRSR